MGDIRQISDIPDQRLQLPDGNVINMVEFIFFSKDTIQEDLRAHPAKLVYLQRMRNQISAQVAGYQVRLNRMRSKLSVTFRDSMYAQGAKVNETMVQDYLAAHVEVSELEDLHRNLAAYLKVLDDYLYAFLVRKDVMQTFASNRRTEMNALLGS